MVDKSLNYGRHVIARYLRDCSPYRAALDIGAGSGADLESARNACPQAELYAVEGYPPHIEHLHLADIKAFPLDIERAVLPFDDCTIDVVIANQILEHTKEVFWIFHEMSRVLPLGGHILLGVPNLASLHNRLLLLFGRQPSPIRTASAHVRGFTLPDLRNFLDSCYPGGFSVVAVAGSNFYPFPPTIAKPLATALPTLAWGLFVKLRKQLPYDGQFLTFPIQARLETNFFLGNSAPFAGPYGAA